MPVDPSDEAIEATLRRATDAAWDQLWSDVDEVGRDARYVTWGGGHQTGTTVVDGVERPIFQMAYAVYSEAADRLVHHLYDLGVIVPFGWPEWGAGERYPTAASLDESSVADAVRFITSVVRSERFAEGSLAGALDDGRLPAALHRLRRWHDGGG